MTGPVDVGIPKMGGLRLGLEEQLFGTTDPVALAVFGFSGQVGILIRGDREAGRHVDGRIEESPVDRSPADGEEMAGPTSEHIGNAPKPPVAGHHHVERSITEDLP